jgi:ubiquinone/menaquinone biosynthesis C-methylase UbiE
MGEWYRRMFEDFFGEYWVKVFERKRGTDQEVSFSRELLGEGLVLDNACGAGRISIPLSCHLTVIGLDLSLYLLKRANQKAEKSGIKSLYLVRGDMRYLPFKSNIFDAVISMWTSFGYFSDKENEVALRENVRVLKPGGKFILDVANPFWLIKNFMEKDWSEDEEYITLEQRSVN